MPLPLEKTCTSVTANQQRSPKGQLLGLASTTTKRVAHKSVRRGLRTRFHPKLGPLRSLAHPKRVLAESCTKPVRPCLRRSGMHDALSAIGRDSHPRQTWWNRIAWAPLNTVHVQQRKIGEAHVAIKFSCNFRASSLTQNRSLHVRYAKAEREHASQNTSDQG